VRAPLITITCDCGAAAEVAYGDRWSCEACGKTWDTARRITIPLALPAVLAGALVAFLQAMTLFGSPAILAMPAGFHTITTKIWSLFQFPPKPELAAAASLPLLVLTVILLRAEHMVLGRRGYSVVGGKNSEPRIVRLGLWRWVMLAVALIVLMCPVFLPYFALLNASFSKVASHLVSFSNFTLQNLHFVFYELSATPLALRNTFILGIMAATCGTILALVISYVIWYRSVKKVGRNSRNESWNGAISGRFIGRTARKLACCAGLTKSPV